MTPENLEKFRIWLAERGCHKTTEEAEVLIDAAIKLQKRLRRTSVEELWSIEKEALEDGMQKEELQELMQLMYYAKELGHS